MQSIIVTAHAGVGIEPVFCVSALDHYGETFSLEERGFGDEAPSCCATNQTFDKCVDNHVHVSLYILLFMTLVFYYTIYYVCTGITFLYYVTCLVVGKKKAQV